MQYFFLTLIILFSFFTKFFFLGRIPLVHSSLVSLIVLSSIGTTGLLIVWSKKLFGSSRGAFLSGFFFSIFPWNIVESRAGTFISLYLFVFMILMTVALYFKNKYFQYGVLFLSVLFVAATAFIKLSTDLLKIGINFLHLNSVTLLGFSNDLFYHGGDREFGVLYAVCIPLIIYGACLLIKKKKWLALLPYVIGCFFSVFNPTFPEVKEYFFALPFFAAASSYGFVNLRKPIAMIFFVLIIFEFSLFFHDYGVHYPIRTNDYFVINNK